MAICFQHVFYEIRVHDVRKWTGPFFSGQILTLAVSWSTSDWVLHEFHCLKRGTWTGIWSLFWTACSNIQKSINPIGRRVWAVGEWDALKMLIFTNTAGVKWEEQWVRGVAETQSTCWGGDKYGSAVTNAINIPSKSGLWNKILFLRAVRGMNL